ncbi:MAG: cupin domain-containing protein [bacterium]|nr:cupin domain-containing protein [bacterium]
MIQYKVDFEGLNWETPMKGVRYKVKKQGDRQLRLVEYTREMEPHWCEKGHTGYILEGTFEIKFTNETLIFKPGDGVFIPSGAEHKHMAKVLTEVVVTIFVEDI